MTSRRLGAMLLLFLLSLEALTQVATPDIDRIKRATVFIYQAKSINNELVVKCVSSGTLISADGLIITKAHSVVPSRHCDGDQLIVSLNVDLTEAPIPKYRAEVFNASQSLDVAILRITRELDGRLIARSEMPILPYVDIGDSDSVALDDNIVVAGLPDFANSPVAIARGTVTAFISEPTSRAPAWLKTRAEIPGTMSGGGAYNSAGLLIGIPTSAQAPLETSATSCRYIADTNGDGLVNSSDTCVPTGDFVSAVRPISLARSLIRGARNNLRVNVESLPAVERRPLNPARASRLFFAPSVSDGMPSAVVGSMPNNANSLFLFFDYDNMTAETVYELRVSRDGIPDTAVSLPPARWSGHESGLWYIGSRGQAWANGAYEFSLLIDGASAGSKRILVGGNAANQAQFSDIVFGDARPKRRIDRKRLDLAAGRGRVRPFPLRKHAYRRGLVGHLVFRRRRSRANGRPLVGCQPRRQGHSGGAERRTAARAISPGALHRGGAFSDVGLYRWRAGGGSAARHIRQSPARGRRHTR